MIKNEDILGYQFGKEFVCEGCIKGNEEKEAKEEEILTTDWAEEQESVIFCDRCKERLW